MSEQNQKHNNNIQIATLNCRGLLKQNSPLTRKHFIRYLISTGFDILILQETHANDDFIINQFNTQFKTTSSLWTKRCGILSLNKNYAIQYISDGLDDRYIFARVVLSSGQENSFGETTYPTLLNILCHNKN